MKRIKLLLSAALMGLLSVASAWQYSHIYVFGDSLSDTGNVRAMTGFYPAAPYWNGRFSNGPVWIESVASYFGVAVNPSLNNGTNYAYGGAQTGTGWSSSLTPNVENQISSFSSRVGSFLPNDLAVLWIGANDFSNGQTDPNVPATRIYNECVMLKNLGAKTIFVPNLPPLGYTPRYFGTASQDSKNAVTVAFNAFLLTKLATFRRANPGIRVIAFDVYSQFMQIRANPAAYGLTNVTQSYIANGSGQNADTFLFWDDVHPTRVIHAMLGNAAKSRLRLSFPIQAVPDIGGETMVCPPESSPLVKSHF